MKGQAEASKLKPKDAKNLKRADLRSIEAVLVEGLENVPFFNDEWGELGLAAVVCSRMEWNKRQDAALAAKLASSQVSSGMERQRINSPEN